MNSANNRHESVIGGLFLLSLAMTVGVYQSGLNGIFLVDDYNNLALLNANGGVLDWDSFLAFVFGGHSGVLGRPIAMLSFLVNDNAFPGSVHDFRLTNVLLHCLCGVAIFVFSRILLVSLGKPKVWSSYISLVAMVWWLLAPLNVSTTLYVIQRMTQLSALFILCGLCFYLRGRAQLVAGGTKGWIKIFIGLYGFGFLALLSKESGALIFIYAGACEVLLSDQKKINRSKLLMFLVLMPLALMVMYIVSVWSGITATYKIRDFTLVERLLTESNILVEYLLKLIVPFSGNMGLIFDDFPKSNSLLSSPSLLIHLALICVSILLRNKSPLILFIVCWFYGGHALESTVIPLELYFEHRNYLPGVGVFIGLAAILCTRSNYHKLQVGLLGLLVLGALVSTKQRAEIWGNPEWQILVWTEEHPQSIRAQTMYADYLLAKQEYDAAEKHLTEMSERWSDALHFDLALYNGRCEGFFSGRPDIESVLLRAESSSFNGNLPSLMQNTMQLYNEQACPELNNQSMHRLVEALNDIDRLMRMFAATINNFNADVYIAERNLTGAMDSLDRVLKFQNIAVVYYKQAHLLYTAGLFSEALARIQLAIEKESSKAVYKQSSLKNYLVLQTEIEKKLKESK